MASRPSKVQRWGNSLAVRIPAVLARQARLDHGSEVEVRCDGETLVIEPVARVMTLAALLGGAAETQATSAVRHSFVPWRPGRGDLVRIDGDSTALVVSPTAYCHRSGQALACVVAEKRVRSSFDVALPAGLSVVGVVAADRVRVLDWREDRIRRVGRAPHDVVGQVCERLATLVC
jgi:antitoxin MazE